ncbi:MAG: hypothetical protein ACRBFS_24060 [Aureispira sp.]
MTENTFLGKYIFCKADVNPEVNKVFEQAFVEVMVFIQVNLVLHIITYISIILILYVAFSMMKEEAS